DFAYLWKDGSTDTAFLVKMPGEIWLEIDRNGCKARDSVQVSYVSQTPLDLGADTILCEGETLVLKTGIPGATNLWQDGSTAPQFSTQTPGEFWVSVSKDGCEYLDTIQVDFTTVEVELGNDTLLCGGTSLYLNVQLPNATYLWQDGTQTSTFEISEPGDFWVKVAQGGCQKSDSISIEYQFSPDTILPDFTTICEKEILRLDASQPDAIYRWHDGSTEPVFTAKSPGKYTVEITLNGCVFKDEVNLFPCENCLFVPNAFSPNGDGFNDEFQAFPGCPIFNFQMQIFDRWGSLVFSSEDPAAGWGGTKKGKKASLGVYVYWISFEIENNHQLVRQERKGDV
ncbi:MAG: gliding motility-associated C-terminal domain-containing protein, partial [Bacteroidota bacterium]